MGLGRPKVALILTDDERVQLDSMAHRSRTAPHLTRRARIVLACAEGHDSTVVAKSHHLRSPGQLDGSAIGGTPSDRGPRELRLLSERFEIAFARRRLKDS